MNMKMLLKGLLSTIMLVTLSCCMAYPDTGVRYFATGNATAFWQLELSNEGATAEIKMVYVILGDSELHQRDYLLKRTSGQQSEDVYAISQRDHRCYTTLAIRLLGHEAVVSSGETDLKFGETSKDQARTAYSELRAIAMMQKGQRAGKTRSWNVPLATLCK